MNATYICTLQKKIQNQKSQRSRVLNLDRNLNFTTEYAMGAAPIAYSVARFRSSMIFHSAGIWCSDGQNLNLAVD